MKKPPKTLWVNVYKKDCINAYGIAYGAKPNAEALASMLSPDFLGTFKYVLEEKED